MTKQNIFQRYSIAGLFYLLRCKLFTLMHFKNARLVRLPIDIRGRKQMTFGQNFTTGKYCRFEIINNAGNYLVNKLVVGDNVQINDSVHIAVAENVTIGNDVLIASKVFISDHNHGNYSSDQLAHDHPLSLPHSRKIVSKPIHIQNKVWIGEFVAILPGVTIGEGSIIGTMSVVSKNIPPYCIAVGSPAKVVKQYNFRNDLWEKV